MVGVQLLREGGTLAFISSNKWFRAGYGQKLRAFVARLSQEDEALCPELVFRGSSAWQAEKGRGHKDRSH